MDSSFTALLDGGKTGVVLKPGVSEQDSIANSKNEKRLNPNFISTRLQEFGKRLEEEAMVQYDKKISRLKTRPSPDDPLLLPLKTVEGSIQQTKVHLDSLMRKSCPCDAKGSRDFVRCRRCREQILAQDKYEHLVVDLKRVKDRVDEIYTQWIASFSKTSGEPSSPSKKARDRTQVQISKNSVTYNFSQPIPCVSQFFPEDAIKVSYAYSKGFAFGFDVAFQTLTHLKATTCHGGAVSSTRTFDGLRNMGGAARKLF